MKKQAVIHGFTLIQSTPVREIGVTANLYEHAKSGAQLLHLACEDTNKVFCMAFKTVPENDTGCPHILEHSVLNGSKNFPGKSTFMELIKGSLHTFINAMTASDLTLYPVASTNDKDFLNLARVYLDAVLYPKIYEQPNILHQEGWHYEFPTEDSDLSIKGVVYNEMKGAFSSPEGIIARVCQHTQFPDTPYGFESGGDPEAIPELTYEKFIAFHEKYYHPSNSKIILYGDMDIDATLKLIDGDYLSHFKKSLDLARIPPQKPFSRQKKLEYQYPVEEGKDISDQYYLCLNYTWNTITDGFSADALATLGQLLMTSPASPLKQKVMESGLAADSSFYPLTDILQPTLIFIFKHVKKENVDALVRLVNAELKRLVKEGFDKKLIEATINFREFFLREGQMQNFPKGLYYAWNSLPLWMHGGDPLDALSFEPMLAELRRGLTEPYFEHILEQALLKNHHSSQITFVPVPGLLGIKEQALREKCARVKAKLSKAEAAELVKFNAEFHAWQNEEADPADLEKIPKLDLEDIAPEAASYPLEEEVWKEFTLLKHPSQTNGIVYLKAYFDLSHAHAETLPWLALYSYLAGQVDSEKRSFADLSNEIDIHTGGINLNLRLFNSYQDPDEILPKFLVSGKAVAAKADQLMELAAEFAFLPKFSDTGRIKKLVRELKTRMETQLLRGGVRVAINRMFAPFSQIHHMTDQVWGLGYYHFLTDLEQRLETDLQNVIEELEWIKANYFTQNNLIISLTASEEDIAAAAELLAPVIARVSAAAHPRAENHFQTQDLNEGIMAPVQIQYCAQGGNFFRKGYPYTGKLRVLNNVISNEFLHREIREKGGAYGVMSDFSLAGYLYICSYMDPNLKETLDVYAGVADYVRGFDCGKREMDKFIIGEISHLDYPKTPETVGSQSDEDYLTGFTQADRQQIRDEVLATRVEDIRSYADLIDSVLAKKHFCVFGNESKVKENDQLFTRLTPVFK